MILFKSHCRALLDHDDVTTKSVCMLQQLNIYRCTCTVYLLLLVLVSCTKDPDRPPPLKEELSVTMLEKVNALRRSGCNCGTTYMPPVGELQWDQHLQLAAERHAEDMYYHDYFNHISPAGSNPAQRAEAAGYKGLYIMENIGKDYTSIDAVMAGWQNSESHCKAMMDAAHTVMGAARRGDYWVQEFGKE